MAHLRSIKRECASCGKPATVELFSTANAPMGTYCKRCGQRAERRLQDSEDARRAVRIG
ncbi:MAG: hypothetical protein KF809_14995 [Chloroflexi bacterium]|nr:hypothetical protein [Chloroflexota bacterium]